MSAKKTMKVRIQLKNDMPPVILNGVTTITAYPVYIYFSQQRPNATLKEQIRKDEIAGMIVEVNE